MPQDRALTEEEFKKSHSITEKGSGKMDQVNSSNSNPRALAPEELEKVAAGSKPYPSYYLRCEYGFTDYCNGHDCALFGTFDCIDGFYNPSRKKARRPAP
jgi:hypothetical protein